MEANLIREQLVKYLIGQISVDVLEDWIAERTYNLHKQSRSEAKELARTVEAKLFEYSGNYISESALKQSLAQLVTSYRAQVEEEVFFFEASNYVAEREFAWGPIEAPAMEPSFA